MQKCRYNSKVHLPRLQPSKVLASFNKVDSSHDDISAKLFPHLCSQFTREMTILLPFFLSRSYEAQVPVLKVFCSVGYLGYNVIFNLKIRNNFTLLYTVFDINLTEVDEPSLNNFF